ncbi:hypothetical protein CCP3SC1_950008 [Gammaproteobacteria bacterium]
MIEGNEAINDARAAALAVCSAILFWINVAVTFNSRRFALSIMASLEEKPEYADKSEVVIATENNNSCDFHLTFIVFSQGFEKMITSNKCSDNYHQYTAAAYLHARIKGQRLLQ